MISPTKASTPPNGFPAALCIINLPSPLKNPNMAYIIAMASAAGSTGMDFSLFNVPLIAANSNCIFVTLVTISCRILLLRH
jgi:hypothetical protein